MPDWPNIKHQERCEGDWPCGGCVDDFDEGYGGVIPRCLYEFRPALIRPPTPPTHEGTPDA